LTIDDAFVFLFSLFVLFLFRARTALATFTSASTSSTPPSQSSSSSSQSPPSDMESESARQLKLAQLRAKFTLDLKNLLLNYIKNGGDMVLALSSLKYDFSRPVTGLSVRFYNIALQKIFFVSMFHLFDFIG
jgi:hypothetical protein